MYNPFQLGKRRPVNKMERRLSIEERRLLSEITHSGWKEYRQNMMYKFIREMNSASRFITSDSPNISDECREQYQKKYDKNKKETKQLKKTFEQNNLKLVNLSYPKRRGE